MYAVGASVIRLYEISKKPLQKSSIIDTYTEVIFNNYKYFTYC